MRKRLWAEIDLSTISHNLRQIKKRVGSSVKIMGVVKANAYGHGLIAVSNLLVKEGIDALCVDNVEEGIELRKGGIFIPILILSSFWEEEVDLICNYQLTPTIFEKETAEILSRRALERGRKIKIHINVDTGMGRAGIPYKKAVEFIEEVNKFAGIEIEGIYTHFSSADEEDGKYSSLQISRFQEVVEKLKKRGIDPPLKHIANSAALLNIPSSFNFNCFNAIRPGLLLYGYYPSPLVTRSISLKPSLCLKSRVIFVKRVPPGSFLSYNRTYVTTRSTFIAILPVGYGDGYPRSLSNRGEVLIRGKRFPLVGRVCMNQSLVDTGDIKVKVEDEVVLWGTQGRGKISLEEVALKANTIPNELVTNLSQKVSRVYLGNLPPTRIDS